MATLTHNKAITLADIAVMPSVAGGTESIAGTSVLLGGFNTIFTYPYPAVIYNGFNAIPSQPTSMRKYFDIKFSGILPRYILLDGSATFSTKPSTNVSIAVRFYVDDTVKTTKTVTVNTLSTAVNFNQVIYDPYNFMIVSGTIGAATGTITPL